MAFDMGFDFRGSSGWVTDPTYAVPVLAEAYPHTYTNTNGDSINAGWTDTVPTAVDRQGLNDPRIAGMNYKANNGSISTFSVDLSSGSAPGAGTYTIDLAFGDSFGARTNDFKLLDTSTVLIDGTNGGSGIATAIDHFVDATLADVAAPNPTAWAGATTSKVFSTTLAKLSMCYDNIGDLSACAHFRLTLQEGAAAAVPPRHFMLLGVGA